MSKASASNQHHTPMAREGDAQSESTPKPGRRYLNYFLLGGLLLLQIVTVGAILLSQHFEGRKTMRVHLQKMMTDAIVEIEDNIQAFLGLPQSTVMVAHGLFASGLLDLRRETELERYFFHQLDTIPQLNGIYYSDDQGQFLYIMRAPDPTQGAFHTKIITIDGGVRRTRRISRDASFEELNQWEDQNDAYDPRVRPWYEKAQREKRLVWTDPYVFFTSRHPGITAAAPILDLDGKVLGIVGVDIEIIALSQFLASQAVGERGSAFVVTRDGYVVAHPHDTVIKPNVSGDRLRLMRYDEVARPLDMQALRLLFNNAQSRPQPVTQFQSFEHQGELYHAGFEPFGKQSQWPWMIGVYAADEDFVGPLRAGERASTAMAVLIGAMITVMAFLLAQRLVAPVADLHEKASRDELTRIMNRRRLFEMGPDMVTRAVRMRRPLCSVMFDIDNFKDINDTYGHAVGDEVLRAVTKRVQSVIAKTDLLARYGGDEFKLVLPDVDLETGKAVAERLRSAVCESPVETTAGLIPVTISAGVAALDVKQPDFDQIVRMADRALLTAKRRGRNRVHAHANALDGPASAVLH